MTAGKGRLAMEGYLMPRNSRGGVDLWGLIARF